jgi:hypothetical protein
LTNPLDDPNEPFACSRHAEREVPYAQLPLSKEFRDWNQKSPQIRHRILYGSDHVQNIRLLGHAARCFSEADALLNQGASKLLSLFLAAAAFACLCMVFIMKWRTGWTLDTNTRILKLRGGLFLSMACSISRAIDCFPCEILRRNACG